MKCETSEASKHVVSVVRAMLLRAAQLQQSAIIVEPYTNSSMTALLTMLQKV